jgi:hypothetical protein
MLKTYAEAQAWLRSQGIEAELTHWGLQGTLTSGSLRYSFQVGSASGGGDEVSVKPIPGRLTWWFWSETLEGIARLLVDARTRVEEGRAASWLEALCALDSTMSWLWPHPPLV